MKRYKDWLAMNAHPFERWEVVQTEVEWMEGRMNLWSSTVAERAPNSRVQAVARRWARVSRRMEGEDSARWRRRRERAS